MNNLITNSFKKHIKDMKNTNLNKIVLVENPLIGKNINVYPILAFFDSQKYTNSYIGGTEGYQAIDWGICKSLLIFDTR